MTRGGMLTTGEAARLAGGAFGQSKVICLFDAGELSGLVVPGKRRGRRINPGSLAAYLRRIGAPVPEELQAIMDRSSAGAAA